MPGRHAEVPPTVSFPDPLVEWFSDIDRVLSRAELNASLTRHRTDLGRAQMINQSRHFWLMIALATKAAA